MEELVYEEFKLAAVKEISETLTTERQASCQYLLVDIYNIPSGLERTFPRNTENTN